MIEPKGLQGIVTARLCPTCGHHEVGITADDGSFHPLRPGSRVIVLEDLDEGLLGPFQGGAPAPVQPREDTLDGESYTPWVPPPLAKNPFFRTLFGVFLPGTEAGDVTPGVYTMAFLEKLRRMIAREENASLAMMLDMHFAAAHLAGGSPKEIARALWEELEEVRAPGDLITSWLKGEVEDLSAQARALYPPLAEDEGEWNADSGQLGPDLDAFGLDAFFQIVA
jgi:hypothetical protein